MASQRLRRTMRGVLAASAVIAAVGLVPAPAGAAPDDPGSASEALKKYNELSAQAEKVAQEELQAEEDLKAKQAELDKANADLKAANDAETAAKADQDQFRGRVDKLAAASYEGARFNQLSAFLVSDSQEDFLNRMSALGVLAQDNKEALDRLAGAVQQADEARLKAEDAQHRAQEATDAATKLKDEVNQRKAELDKQARAAKEQYDRLSAKERTALQTEGTNRAQAGTSAPAGSGSTGTASSTGTAGTPGSSGTAGSTGTAGSSGTSSASGAAAAAVQFALAQLGDTYRYGATGPDQWDCSSLTQAAYRSAGISIPRTSAAQAGIGKSVSRSQVKAGDLLFYYSPVHHVAMAIDGTRAVHAATEGVPVKIANIDSIGPLTAIKRVVG